MLRRSVRNANHSPSARSTARALGVAALATALTGCMLERQGALGSQCASDAQCDDANVCTTELCDPSGLCLHTPLPDGVAGEQTAGDCLRVECAAGATVAIDDGDDVPADDGDACTLERCGADGPVHEPQDDGAPCTDGEGNPGLCQAHECLVECTPTTTTACDDTETCTDDGCDPATGQCLHLSLSGIPAPEQTAADCRLVFCTDGVVQPTLDNSDVLDDGNSCTADRCEAGVPLNLPLDVGTACDTEGGRMCNGDATAPACVGCLAPSDCPGEVQLCRGPTCTDGQCGEDFDPLGTALGPDAAGDCLRLVCDGAGAPVTAVDSTDLPDDGNPCTLDLCTEQGAGHDFASDTTTCGADDSLSCDGAGSCVGCNASPDCGVASACMSWSCVGGACIPVYEPADSVPAELEQVTGDCLERRCNGMGGVSSVAMDSDLPADDPLDCIAAGCILGTEVSLARPINVACGLDDALVCDGAGECVECNAASQCPDPGVTCWQAACIDHECGSRVTAAGIPAAPDAQPAGDCHLLVCNGLGGTTSSVDDADVPVDGNDCTQDVCTAGEPSNPLEPEGTPCGPVDEWSCDPAGRCIECSTDDDCTDPDVCNTSTGRCDCATEPCSRCMTERVHRYGNGVHDQVAEALAATADSVAVGGRLKAPVDLGAGLVSAHTAKYDGFVAVYDTAGALRWTRLWGDGVSDQHVMGVAVDDDGGVVVTGRFKGTVDFGGRAEQSLAAKYDGYVARYGPTGGLQWVRTFGNGADDQHAEGVAVDHSGNALVTGRITDGVDFGDGQLLGSATKYDLFLASYDAAGELRWAHAFGNGADDQHGQAVAVDGSGNVVVTGRIEDGVDFGGGVEIGSAGKLDIVIASYDADGAYRWAKALGNNGQDQFGESVAVDSDGNVLVTGRIMGGVDMGGGQAIGHAAKYDIVVASYTASGTYRWAQAFGNGAHDQFGESVAVDSVDNVIVTGRTKGGVDFGGGQPIGHATKFDIVALMLDPLGVHLCSKAFGDGLLDQRGEAVASLGVERFVLTGTFQGSVDFGLGPLASAGAKYDIFLAQLGP